MSTQINTLPAIRALIWERWRVMRWVAPAAWLGYGSVIVLYHLAMGDGFVEWNPAAARLSLMELDIFFLPLYAVACVALTLHIDSKNIAPFPLERHRLLPLSTNLMMTVQLTTLWISILVLGYGLFAVERALLGSAWAEFRASVTPMVLTGMFVGTLAMMLGAWSRNAGAVFLLMYSVVFARVFLLEDSDAPAQLPAAGLIVGIVTCGALCVAGARFTRGGAFTGLLQGRWDTTRAESTPALTLTGPFQALLWREWREWGRWLVAGAAAWHAGLFLLLYLPMGPGGDSWDTVGDRFVVPTTLVLAAFAVGVVLAIREMSGGFKHGGGLLLAIPLSTRRMALMRMAIHTAFLSAAMVAVAAVTALIWAHAWMGGYAGRVADSLFPVFLIWPLYGIVAWLCMFAAVPLYLVGIGLMITWGILSWLSIFGLVSTEYDWTSNAAIGMAAILLIATVVLALADKRIALRTAAVCILPGVLGFGALFHQILNPPDSDHFLLGPTSTLWWIAAVSIAIVYPFIWQPLWLHWCRHGSIRMENWSSRT